MGRARLLWRAVQIKFLLSPRDESGADIETHRHLGKSAAPLSCRRLGGALLSFESQKRKDCLVCIATQSEDFSNLWQSLSSDCLEAR